MNRYTKGYERDLQSRIIRLEDKISKLQEEYDDLDEDDYADWFDYHDDRERVGDRLSVLEIQLEDARKELEDFEEHESEVDAYYQGIARLKWYGGGKLPQSVASCEWWTIPLYPETANK